MSIVHSSTAQMVLDAIRQEYAALVWARMWMWKDRIGVPLHRCASKPILSFWYAP